MIKRTIEISGERMALRMRHNQIIVRHSGAEVAHIPMEDVGVLIVDTPTANYTHSSLVRLVEFGAVVVLCGENHLPVTMLTALQGNGLLPQRLRLQIGASQAMRKRIWQEIVREKILNQAACCEDATVRRRLLACAKSVRSGDPQNVEAQAARFYWSSWIEAPEFRRSRDGEPPNNLLNYGYAVMRAAMARALCGTGLHPALGVHHDNRTNGFALADDLMEVLRPLVDQAVRQLWRRGEKDLTKDVKRALLELLTGTCEMDGQTGPLFVAMERMAVSVVGRLNGQQKRLRFPNYCRRKAMRTEAPELDDPQEASCDGMEQIQNHVACGDV